MAHVLSNLQRLEPAAARKINGLEREPLSTSASEAQRSSANESTTPPSPREALSLQPTADAGQSQTSIFSTEDAVTQLQVIDVPQGNSQSAVQAMSVVQASPPWALRAFAVRLPHVCLSMLRVSARCINTWNCRDATLPALDVM